MTGPRRLDPHDLAPADLFERLHPMAHRTPPGFRPRSVKVDDTLWDAAKAKADDRNESLSAVIRTALERYVKRA